MNTFHSVLSAAGWGLVASSALGVATWLVSVLKKDVSIVDSVWSLLIMAAAGAACLALDADGPRSAWVFGAAAVWALRLAGYITWRNWGEAEDRRYRDIRARNQPHFALKSLYLVFLLQAVLAWIVALPIVAATAGNEPLNWLDALGLVVAVFGFLFETIGDAQLARFRGSPQNAGLVMDRGLWRYTRHPNYFGEFCVWWGFFLVALAAHGWWSAGSPLLMSFLLLRVSGVTLLEKDIGERRPAYRDYVARTNAFFPGAPRRSDRTAG